MAAEQAEQAGHAAPRREPQHWLRMGAVWFVAALAGDLIIWFVLYPHLPPGRMTDVAQGQQFDFVVLSVTAWPVVAAVWTFFGYALIVWRQRKGDETDGPPITGSSRSGIAVQASWIIATTMIVLWAFAFGTYELFKAGAGGGEGPAPIWHLYGNPATTSSWTPGSGNMLQVQVIGQQWYWTYRYPQFGGMESTVLYLPANTPIEFHVTSLDVIHSFWAYKLGVKADANPNTDNVAYATTSSQMGHFVVRCNELCGIWHGSMYNAGEVVTPTAFQTWANGVQSKEQADGTLAALPPYTLTYDPTVIPQLGKTLTVVEGITGANGYYYPGAAQAGTPNGPPVSP